MVATADGERKARSRADAVKAMVTLGEISDTLREVWGVYRPA
jgi:methylmalonyl-CoA mutase N-terminal domain/subunit